MKTIWLTLLLLIGTISPDPEIEKVRSLYERAANEESACRQLLQLTIFYDERSNPRLAGYRGAATMIMAKFMFNPFSKLAWFHRGKSMLEKAIVADSQNVELHFLRYSVQENCPRILGYDHDIGRDKALIMQYMHTNGDSSLQRMIRQYFGRHTTKTMILFYSQCPE